LLREAKLFDAKLGSIDGAGNVGSHLIGLVVSKTVVQPKAEPKTEPKQESEAKTSEEKTQSTEAELEKSSTEAT
jgi:vacuolar protein sorting-associated protein 54